ncbi:hypothetical protein BpHYR1_039076 [Brachionus plicatilis]|uniref:Uncharacterized protein n=1 Tax=Brachionus plicatilis TaxID=10195 RepID=A0A3M7RZ70_BRAPC|nr:hypothetical protein BpHYR1_039076 [Brachionus plicatilis]
MKLLTLSLVLVVFALFATKSAFGQLSLQEIIRLLQEEDQYYPGQGLPGLPGGGMSGAGGGGGGSGLPGLPGMPGRR